MSVSANSFHLGLYREHLEEAAFLYEQRRALQKDPEISWLTLKDFEERLEAHIDALVVGGEPALAVCSAQAEAGEPGELFAALCVYCRQQETSLFAAMWRQLDFEDAARVQAVTDALKLEFPTAWTAASEQAIARADPGRFPILAVAAAYRGLPVGAYVAAVLAATDSPVDPRPVSALARLQGSGSKQAFEKCLRSPAEGVRSNALLGLLRAGDVHALETCYLTAQTEDWPHLGMGLAGDRHAATILRQRVEAGRASRDTLLALGLLGDLTVVRALTTVLDSPDLAETGALALHWITGAPLYSQVFVAEAVDERELFEGEIREWREQGVAPRRQDGRAYGSDVRQLSHDPGTWNRWLSEHAAEFDPNIRYRRGRPYALRIVFECLLAPSVPAQLRQLVYEEMVLRYGCPESFESDARVADQLTSLGRIAEWVRNNEARFEQSRGMFFRGRA